MINQSRSGQFVICGDTIGHDMISSLIEYYKTNPIQPFGEYLTSPSFEVSQSFRQSFLEVTHTYKNWGGLTGVLLSQELHEDLYDIIQTSPVLPVKNTQRQQNSVQPPTRPPKNRRTLEVSKVGDIFLTISHYLAFAELTFRTRLVL